MFINISNLLMILKSNRGEHFTSPKKFQHFHQSHLTKKKKHPQKTRRHLKEYTSLIIIKPGYTNNAMKDCMTANSSRQKTQTFEQVSTGIKSQKCINNIKTKKIAI